MEAVIQTDEENHVRSIHLKDVIYISKSYSYWLSDDPSIASHIIYYSYDQLL